MRYICFKARNIWKIFSLVHSKNVSPEKLAQCLSFSGERSFWGNQKKYFTHISGLKCYSPLMSGLFLQVDRTKNCHLQNRKYLDNIFAVLQKEFKQQKICHGQCKNKHLQITIFWHINFWVEKDHSEGYFSLFYLKNHHFRWWGWPSFLVWSPQWVYASTVKNRW